jgi:hypothetical protein
MREGRSAEGVRGRRNAGGFLTRLRLRISYLK